MALNQEELEDQPVLTEEDAAVEKKAEKSSNIVSILVIIGRITGFFRTSVQAWAIGALGLASAYTVANNLPNLLYELVMGGMLITSFLPVYMSVKSKRGKQAAADYASNLTSIVVLVMLVVLVLSLVFAAPIVWTQSAGATEGFDSELAIYFFRWFAIEVVLYALSSLISGVLNAERDYFASNVAPILNNVITIAGFLIYGFLVNDLGLPMGRAIVVLAIANPLGVAVQVLAQVPALMRHGVTLRPHINLHDPALGETLKIGLPTLVLMLISTPTAAVTSSCALSVTPAGASIAYYARVWYVLPFSIFAIPISVTMFTELSGSYMAGKLDTFKGYLASGIRKIVFTLVPMTLYLIVFAPYLVAVFTAGSFSGEAAQQTATYLQCLALALPFYGLSSYLQKACSSMIKMNFYMVATIVATVLQIAMCVGLTPLWGLYVVPISSTFFYGSVVIVTLLYIRRELGSIGMKSIAATAVRAFMLGLLGSLVGILILVVLRRVVGPCQGVLLGALYCVVGGIPSVLVTFGLAYAQGISEAPFFDALFGRIARRLGIHRAK
ncbi:murein biosynthesis integral membrane protein MurJ [uncultured Parolsenella sp.]|uniref:murein biosynthesis integral membrane protein MurJ n=1 Tax=uncultured Parolsenella sp. TaxID=2083008 RepID=UPI0027DBF203|nr:murein biosynthesis integral membrane protein MurJ [uncultured Parolsenella sp.]